MERVVLSGVRSAKPYRRGSGGTRRVLAVLAAVVLIAACRHSDDSRDTPPTAEPDSARTRPGATVDVDVLVNDRDDGPLTVEIASPPNNASAAVTSANLIRVSPAADFVGSVELTYVARDRQGAASAPARVTVDVAPTARTLVTVYDEQGRARHYLADTVESQLLGTSGEPGCAETGGHRYSSSGDVLVLMTCATDGTHVLLAAFPRSTALRPPVTLLGGEYLLPDMFLSADGRRVVVIRFTGDPLDDAVPRTYEVLSLATVDGSILGRWPVPDVTRIIGGVAGGPADKIILYALHFVAGSFRRHLLTVDVVAGTIERTAPLTAASPQIFLDAPGVSADGRLFVYDFNSENVTLYDTSQPQVVRTLWASEALQLVDSIGLVPGTYDALVNRRTGRLPPPAGVPGPPGIPLSAPTLWLMPVENPAARRVLAHEYTGHVAVRGDGQRLVYSRRTTEEPIAYELVEIAIADGSELAVLARVGGLSAAQPTFSYAGASADLVVLTTTPAGEELHLIWRTEPGTLLEIGGDRAHSSFVLHAVDVEATATGFSIAEASSSGAHRVFLADMNAPTVSVPVPVPASAGADVFIARVFGSPQ